MKAKPLIIIGAIFAASFSGRAIGFADAALDSSKKTPVEEAKPDSTPEGHTEPEKSHHETDVEKGAPQIKQEVAKPEIAINKPVSAAHKAQQISELLKDIRERSATLDEKAEAVEDRIRLLELVEARIDEKLTTLKEANRNLSERVTLASEASQTDISQLAKMYEQMKPQKAGEIFNAMEPTFAAGFLTEMNSESAALILTNMNTDKAYAASMKIASRNAAVHQQ